MPNLENLTGFDWISLYTNIKKNDNIIKKILPTFNINFIDGPFVEIKHSSYKNHKVNFINKSNNFIDYSNNIGNNCWIKTNKKYFVDWKITVEDENGNLIHDYDLNFENETVYIALDSKSLGDTLAWFPYVEEFRKKHKCKIICSTFHNNMFKPYYPQFKFIKPGEVAHGIKAMYTIGWFYEGDNGENINHSKNPYDFKSQNMQKTASDILGLEFKEVKPIITNKNPLKKKQIAIAIHGTTQAKYWNNPTGWQEVVNWCKDKGYEVKLLSREGDGYMGNNHPKGITTHPEGPLDLVMDELLQSEVFIGIGSGLSWLSWALNVPTVLISGFSKDYTEPSSCYRILAPEGKCNGCFNTHRLDAGDWNWCPVHKGTSRQFECSKSITSEMVIEKLKEILVVS
jgi:autotransporter strand-loop-strand O-heptosyltransferase